MAQIGDRVTSTIPRIHMEPFSAHMDLWRPQIDPFPCFRTSSQVSAPIGPCGCLVVLVVAYWSLVLVVAVVTILLVTTVLPIGQHPQHARWELSAAVAVWRKPSQLALMG